MQHWRLQIYTASPGRGGVRGVGPLRGRRCPRGLLGRRLVDVDERSPYSQVTTLGKVDDETRPDETRQDAIGSGVDGWGNGGSPEVERPDDVPIFRRPGNNRNARYLEGTGAEQNARLIRRLDGAGGQGLSARLRTWEVDRCRCTSTRRQSVFSCCLPTCRATWSVQYRYVATELPSQVQGRPRCR